MSMDESKRKTLTTEDRISTLPDDVICHILSLLNTKDAVRTSALSTRWRYLFASVTVLRFYDFSGINESQEVRGRKFTEFVNGLLNRHDVSDISLFEVELSFGYYDNYDVNSWIYSAIRRNVRNIKVVVLNTMFWGGSVRTRSLVPDLFTCKTLVDLALYGSFDLSVPESVCLPNLKKCCLGSILMKVIDDGSLQRLFSSCPKLEKLNLLGCDVRNIKDFELHIPSLKMFLFYRVHADKILLNAPNLEYFEYYGGGPSVLCKGIWKSIVKASIRLEKEFKLAEENMSQLANNLIEVKYLSLCSQSMELLQQSRLLPTFNNLNHLELKANSKAGWKLLPNLLHKTPRLEVLVIHYGFMDDYVYAEITESLPICLSQQLKVAKVCVSIEDQSEFKWIKFLLKIARVLKKLIVYPYPPKTVRELEDRWSFLSPSQIAKELSAFPRVSKTCQVEIAEHYEYFWYGHLL